jgi:CNT family concentrative nucleoside transporter
MSWISALGVVVILALAWSMSANRRAIRPRVVVWGLLLQLVFALMILRDDAWSYVGMSLLGGLIAVFLLRRTGGEGALRWGPSLAALLSGVVLVVLLGRQVPQALGPLCLVLLVGLLVPRRFGPPVRVRPFLGAALCLAGGGWLVVRGIHGRLLLSEIAQGVARLLTLSDYGARFLFGHLADARYFYPEDPSVWPGFGYQFAFQLLPVIVFFGGLMSVLYYLGVMQRIIESTAHFMRWTLGTSGAETLCSAANIFIGQTEAPLLIRPYLPGLTHSELVTVMVAGFATIAGGGMAAYIALGVPAGHLLAASVMSAPAALVISKILDPETGHSETAGDVRLPRVEAGGNVIEAATNGITDGLRLAVNVGAMLIGFIALIAVVDLALNWLDRLIDGRWLGGELLPRAPGGLSPVTQEYVGLFPGSLQTLFGTALRPIAWLLGVPWADAATVGALLGIKLSLNEFVGYTTLVGYIRSGQISERAIVLSTYALCGFANFASIGIQIGGLAALAPGRKSELARVGLRAMVGGALASWLTAAVAGTLIRG